MKLQVGDAHRQAAVVLESPAEEHQVPDARSGVLFALRFGQTRWPAMGFRTNLQYLRAEHHMAQEQLAMLLGVSRQSVTK